MNLINTKSVTSISIVLFYFKNQHSVSLSNKMDKNGKHCFVSCFLESTQTYTHTLALLLPHAP